MSDAWPNCDHDYVYSGVRWKYGNRVAGSGSKEILYYEAFFCRKCMDRRYVKLGYEGNSYDPINYNATPIEKDAPV